MEEEKPTYNFSEMPQSIKDMEQELAEEEKQQQEDNLKQIQERNNKARALLKKVTEPLVVEYVGIEFRLSSISVASWDEIQGDKDSPSARSIVVRNSMLSPELSDEEFKLLPAGLKYKLFMYLLQDFFLIAGKVIMKDTS